MKFVRPARPSASLASRNAVAAVMATVFAVAGFGVGTVLGVSAPAEGQASAAQKPPKPPANGVIGLVVQEFVSPVIADPTACPRGATPKMRDAYVARLPEAERARLTRKENEPELTQKWKAETFGPNDSNLCSQPDMFQRPLQYTVESKLGWGLDLDGDGGSGTGAANGCAHQDFVSPSGDKGIDNQEYRAMGCTLEMRGKDGNGGDSLRGSSQFMTSGEWTQVILISGVDSLENDDDVQVIYGNTPDRPDIDGQGNFLPNQSFSISDRMPRRRNVLHGRIVNGVLTTDTHNIVLTQTYGQGGAREIRGTRTAFDFRHGQLKLTFHPDGTATGFVGGYRPLWDLISAASLGAAGSANTAGIDCASQLATVKKMADGDRDPKTGQCTTISSAYRIKAIPAFVNDIPAPRTASRGSK